MREELISVFTVNWNGKKWLEKYLRSLEKQSYKNIENILVDNSSSDGSVEYVRKHFPKVKIVQNKKNLGLARATNVGIKSSTGKFILFLNNDTWFDKDFIKKLYAFYDKNDYMVVSAAEKRYFNDEEFKCNTTIDITGGPAYFEPKYSRKDKIFYLTVCFLCKKEDYVKTGGLDSDFFMYYEDVDWFWRLSLQGKKFAVDTNNFIHHVGAGSTGSGIKYNFFLWRNQNTLQSLLKNFSLYALLIILPIYFIQNLVEILFFILILKPQIAKSYVEGWLFNIHHIKRTLRKRNRVQRTRKVNDLQILSRMYMGSGKFLLLKDYLKLQISRYTK